MNQFIKALSIGSILSISSSAYVAAEKIPDSEQDKKLSNSADLITNNEQSRLFNSKLPPSVKSNLESSQLSNSDSVFLELTSGKIVQASDSTPDTTEDIIKPAQQAIPSTEKLNPSSDLLSLPKEADEVEVGTQKSITLEQAIKLSLKNNKELQVARIQVESAEAALSQQRASLFPTLGLGSRLSYSDSAFLDSIFEQQGGANSLVTSDDSFDFDADLSINYDIYTGGQRGASIRAAEKQLRATELDLETITEDTRLETASNYYSLQDSDAQVKIEESAVEDAQQTLKDAQLLEKAGLGTKFDVLRAEVELAQAQQRLSTAIANQNIARRQLAETLSVSHNSDLSTADAIEEAGNWELSLPQSIIQAFDNRAELEQSLLQKEIAQEQKTISLSSVRPTLSANGSYAFNEDFNDNFDSTDNYQVALQAQWNFFDGGAARAGARQSEKDIEIAETQFADQRNQIRFGVEQAFFGLEANEKNIGTATKEVDLAEESLRLARLRFQAGVGTQTDVIEAQTQLTTARGNLLSSIIDYNQSYADLQRQVSNNPEDKAPEIPEDKAPEIPEDEVPEIPEDSLQDLPQQ